MHTEIGRNFANIRASITGVLPGSMLERRSAFAESSTYPKRVPEYGLRPMMRFQSAFHFCSPQRVDQAGVVRALAEAHG